MGGTVLNGMFFFYFNFLFFDTGASLEYKCLVPGLALVYTTTILWQRETATLHAPGE